MSRFVFYISIFFCPLYSSLSMAALNIEVKSGSNVLNKYSGEIHGYNQKSHGNSKNTLHLSYEDQPWSVTGTSTGNTYRMSSSTMEYSNSSKDSSGSSNSSGSAAGMRGTSRENTGTPSSTGTNTDSNENKGQPAIVTPCNSDNPPDWCRRWTKKK
jgi:hypothetical protein